MIATRLMDQPKATVLSGTENATDAIFSPNGQWIAFSADQKLKKISVNGGAAVTLCDALTFRGASWGEDGYIYASLGSLGSLDKGRISRVSEAAGGRQEVETAAAANEHSHAHRWPQVLPGGRELLFTAASPGSVARWDDATIEVLSLRSGQYKTVQRGGHFGRYLPSGHLLYTHQGTVFGVPFDLGRLETRGVPAPVQAEVAASASAGETVLDFSWGPSGHGTLVYLNAGSSGESVPAMWLDAAGTRKPLWPSPPGVLVSPRLSPDGGRLAVSLNGDIWVYDLERGSPLRLSFTPAAINNYPVWAPDGKHLVYSPTLGGIWWVRSDGSSQPQLLYEAKSSALAWSLSPDGKRLAFHKPGKNRDIFTLPLDLTDPDHPKAGQPELFLATPGVDADPMFSPDGRWMAYSSDESGNFVVSVRPFPARPNGGKWQISSTPGSRFPIWSRTSKELFYVAATGHIMVVPYGTSGETFSPSPPRQWSPATLRSVINTPPLDLAPDGKRFAAFLGADNASGNEKVNVHVTFLLNFFDEMKRKMP